MRILAKTALALGFVGALAIGGKPPPPPSPSMGRASMSGSATAIRAITIITEGLSVAAVGTPGTAARRITRSRTASVSRIAVTKVGRSDPARSGRAGLFQINAALPDSALTGTMAVPGAKNIASPYYFILQSGAGALDDQTGTVLPDDQAARDYAQRIIGELKDAGDYDETGPDHGGEKRRRPDGVFDSISFGVGVATSPLEGGTAPMWRAN